jgi:hypothetical protein
VSPQWSIHHLTVRRGGCQPGCPDVWQKRHARAPPLLQCEDLLLRPGSRLLQQHGLLRQSQPFASAFKSSAPPGCARARVPAGDAAARGPPHPPAAPRTTPPNDARHVPQMGTRLAPASSSLQTRHPAGKNTLTRASPIPVSHPRPAASVARASRDGVARHAGRNLLLFQF